MKLPLILRPEAVEDLLSTRDWYDKQRVGLGDEFTAEASAALDGLSAAPGLFGVIWEDTRACRLRRFPFVVFYRVRADFIEVLAILHASRDPSSDSSTAIG
ncbi:MAG: type II toxin-antitoxin system RelE/ParE family toxin [Isosphaeraceae bacterium]|nr:type II toxin-antitoxin system RelE/ParE family toxin [Isosphaeraceae bacterium]